MSTTTLLEAILTELKTIRDLLETRSMKEDSSSVKRNEIFIPPKIPRITLVLRKIGKGYYCYYSIDMPNKHDKPVSWGGYFKEEERAVAFSLLVTNALETLSLLKKPEQDATLFLQDLSLLETITSDPNGYTTSEYMSMSERAIAKLNYATEQMKVNNLRHLRVASQKADYRMKEINKIIDKAEKEYNKKE